ncbi:MAG: cytochrome c biogenesis protein CcsA [Nitrospirae bacterium]|nr:cytochrome c biogenesis protein CcsA [Nitrospirota bacterium]
METIITFFSIAVVLYGVSTLFYLISFIRKKEYFIRHGVMFAGLGFFSHTLCLSFYWARPSYLSFSTFQVINDAAWSGIFIFLLVLVFAKSLRPAGILITPFTMFTMIWAAVSKKEIGPTPPAFETLWFWIHVVTSALAYGFVLIAGAIGLLYIFKTKHAGDAFYDGLADMKKLDDLNYLFIGLGFTMLTLMIISGSLWTHKVQGSYWGWDPLEVQSLISWLVYAIWLHLRLTFGWRGIKLAWYSLFALPVMVIAIWGIPFVPELFHRGFRVTHQ